MTDAEPSRAWMIHAADHLLAAVVQYRNLVRQFCLDLGVPWQVVTRDATYFAEKMREARAARKDHLQRLRALVPRREAWQDLPPEGQVAVDDVDGFLTNLLAETRGLDPGMLSLAVWFSRREQFDLKGAQKHLLTCIPPGHAADLRSLPPFASDPRLDLISKFIAAVFLHNAGAIDIHQTNSDTIILIRPTADVTPAESIACAAT
jgi:hypothetical protein